MRFRGKVMLGDQVVVDAIEAELAERRVGPVMKEWDGELIVPGPPVLELRRLYRLVLEDRRSGEFFVTGAGSRSGSVRITGAGALQ